MTSDKQVTVSLIVAMAHNRVIGKDNDMPWHLSEDLKHFKRVTLGKPVIMGRKTWESLGRPLPGRPNLVVTRQQEFQPEGASVHSSLADAINFAKLSAKELGVSELMIIGGAQIYEAAMPFVDRMYITEIDTHVEGDTFFPIIENKSWKEVTSESLTTLETAKLASVVKVFEKR